MSYTHFVAEDAAQSQSMDAAVQSDFVKRANVEFRKRIDDGDFSSLFLAGCCFDFALALANLMKDAEIIYFQGVERPTQMAHVAVRLSGEHCLDFSGTNIIAELSEKFSGWSNIAPIPVTKRTLTDFISKRNLLPELQREISTIAKIEAEKLILKIK